MNGRSYKSPGESQIEMNEIVYPNDTNPMNMLNGGRLLQWMDTACAISAQTHSEKICVTVAIDSLELLRGAKLGDVIRIRAKVTRSFSSSIEVRCTVTARRIGQNLDFSHEFPICSAYFVFVALGGDSQQPVTVPGVLAESEEERSQFEEALVRRQRKDWLRSSMGHPK